MENRGSQRLLDISWETIFKVSIMMVFFYILFSIRDIVVWFIFALIISVLFDPVIDFLQKRRVPRIFGVIIVYLGFFGIFGLLISMVVPLFAYETKQFVEALPVYFEKVSPPLRGLGFEAFASIESFILSFGSTLESMGTHIFGALFAFFGGVFSTLFVITTGFFLSMEDKIFEKGLMLLFPKKYEASALSIWQTCRKKVSGWFGARVLACSFVGVISYITFLLFNVKYPFTLGLLAGVLNFIPYIGPAITGIILFLVIFPLDIMKAIFVLIAFALIQQIEGNVLTPILMRKIVGIPPALVLVALVIGGKLWGVMGAILAIPLAGILFEFTKEFLRKKKEKEDVVV